MGRTDVEAMLSEIPPDRLHQWIVYSYVEPFQTDRIEMQLAKIAASFGEGFFGKEGRSIEPSDFMIVRPSEKPAEPQTPEEMKRTIEIFRSLVRK